MGVAALAGLYMMLIAGIAFAAIIAVCEFTWRKRKLAVDENVSVSGNFVLNFNLISSLDLNMVGNVRSP